MSQPEGRIYSRIAGTGSYLPEKVLTNADLTQFVETSDEWIVARTGIRERHVAAEGETTSDLGYQAALRAMEAAGVTAADIDLIVLGTTTPDLIFPSSACLLQHKLGANGCPAFDVNAACSGFIYALTIADKFIQSGAAKTALVVGSETLTRMLDWSDRGTCVLFGDGAGAIVLKGEQGTGTSADRGILANALHSDGRQHDILYVDGGPSSTRTTGFLRMEGKEVFKHAVDNMAAVVGEVLEKAGLQSKDIDWLVPHQANKRIIDGSAKKLGIPLEKVVVTVDLHGNTSAASIPLALAAAANDGRIKEGDIVLLEAMGGGFTWGAVLLRW